MMVQRIPLFLVIAELRFRNPRRRWRPSLAMADHVTQGF